MREGTQGHGQPRDGPRDGWSLWGSRGQGWDAAPRTVCPAPRGQRCPRESMGFLGGIVRRFSTVTTASLDTYEAHERFLRRAFQEAHERVLSSARTVRGSIADRVHRWRSYICICAATLSASDFPGAALHRHSDRCPPVKALTTVHAGDASARAPRCPWQGRA